MPAQGGGMEIDYMWNYQKRLQYPINIKNPNPKLASFIVSQYGGPHGEMGAAMRYLSQRFSMPNEISRATLTDIGTEEYYPTCYRLYYPFTIFLKIQ